MFCRNTVRATKIFAAIIIVLVASCKTAQKSTETAPIVLDQPIPTENTLLWQVSGNGLTQPSYLFGTIHVISSEDFELSENVLRKLDNAQQLILEMDLKNINTLEVAQKSILPDNKTIKDYLSEEDYLAVESYFADSLGSPLALFKTAYARLKPFFLQQMIYVKYLGDNTSSYEMELMHEIDDRDVEIIGLETLSEQLSFIDEMTIEEQYSSLLKSIKEGYQQSQYLDTLVQAYKSRDLNKLYEMVVSNEEIKDITNTLIDQRNINWIPKLEDAFRNKCSFVAVGAGHLGGPSGVIALLREKGYTVEPISMD